MVLVLVVRMVNRYNMYSDFRGRGGKGAGRARSGGGRMSCRGVVLLDLVLVLVAGGDFLAAFRMGCFGLYGDMDGWTVFVASFAGGLASLFTGGRGGDIHTHNTLTIAFVAGVLVHNTRLLDRRH